MSVRQYAIEAAKAGAAAIVAYLAMNYSGVDLAESVKQIVALVALALWARFGPRPA